jgi:hypothetical protein
MVKIEAFKKGKKDEREDFLKTVKSLLPHHVKCTFIGINNQQPVWGRNFIKKL